MVHVWTCVELLREVGSRFQGLLQVHNVKIREMIILPLTPSSVGVTPVPAGDTCFKLDLIVRELKIDKKPTG